MRNVQIYSDLDGIVQALRSEKQINEIADQWLQRHKEYIWNEGHEGQNQLYIHFSKLDDSHVRAFVDFYGCHYWRSREEGQNLSCALRNALNHLELVHNKMADEGGPAGDCPYDLPETEKLEFHL